MGDSRQRLRWIGGLFICMASLIVGLAAASAEDWPTYRHDVARSGITAEQLDTPLMECWAFRPRRGPEPAWDPPKPEPVEGILELPRVHFDDAFQVAVAGDSLTFGSSSEDKVYCLDAATGKIKWTKRLGGPVRLAPTVWNNRVFVGCDDGVAYCLNAADGSEAWTFQAAPHKDMVLGSGKMISLWPMRTGVLVDDDTAYFAAGLFPMEGVYLYAVNAEEGALVWKNDTCGETPQSAISPQGYLLASKTTLFAPMGRVSPAAFERKTGLLRHTAYFGKTVGGTYALLAEGRVFTGTGEMMAYDENTRAKFAWYPGRQLIVTPEASYMVNDTQMIALDRVEYPKISLKRTALVAKQEQLNNPLYFARKKVSKLKAEIKQNEETLATLEKQMEDLTKKGRDAEVETLKAQQKKINVALTADKTALPAAETAAATLAELYKTMKEEVKKADEEMTTCFRWQCPCECPDSLILAGTVLFAGGKDKVVAVDVETGKDLWTGKVDGKARGLAVASGRLFVSTDKGTIHCFAPKGAEKIGAVTESVEANPYPKDDLAPIYKAAADHIVRETGIKQGYCLVLGCGEGRLAYELAKRTDLVIYGVEPDAAKAEAARKALDDAGLYGARVRVDARPYDGIPYSDYFANLIVSDNALVSGELPPDASEALRMLKPLGGTLCIGQPAEASGKVKSLSANTLDLWLISAGITGGEVSEKGGLWLTYKRGALEGAGSWTHEYANPANTTCGDDQRVQCPLGTLWFGRPGPTRIVNRHQRAAAPLAMDGRLFLQGENVIMAYDSYNGLKLWERDIPGAMRTGVSSFPSNLALSKDGLFVVVKDQCLRLDPATGETTKTYSLPEKDKPAGGFTLLGGSTQQPADTWGAVFCVGDTLYGTRTKGGAFCESLFALDVAKGGLRWTHTGKQKSSATGVPPVGKDAGKTPVAQPISHASISFGDGKVFLIETEVTNEDRDEALKDRMAQVEKLTGVDRINAEKELKAANVRMVVALDAATGELIWKKPLDATGCGSGLYWSALATMYNNGVLVVFGVYSDGHYWKEFFAGEFESRRVVAMSAEDGETLWTRTIGYRVRPLIIGDTFHAEPWAYDLKTGEQKTRTHPVTGRPEPWQFARPGHHCGCPAASPQTLLFRSGSFGYYDLVRDDGTMHFGTQRTGCWINFIPANGVLLFPEGSAGCMCPFPNQCSYAFQHKEKNRAWAQYSAIGSMTPVKHLAINLGAPGDRRGVSGPLWLGFPRSGGSLVLRYNIGLKGLPGGGYFKHNADTIEIEGTDSPWIYASGFLGLSRCVVPLLSEEDGDMRFTVRLAFADLDNDKPGVRVFDIKLQDKVVCKDFDIVKEAGGKNKAIVKEFKEIAAKDDLKIELAPKAKKPTKGQLPVLQGFEVVREKVLGVGCAAPSFLLSDAEPEQSGEVRIANNTETDFSGALQAVAPDGFIAAPKETEIALAPGDRTTVTLKVALADKMPMGKYEVGIRLVREDGRVECERKSKVEHLANRGRLVLKAIEDAHVGKSSPDTNAGGLPSLIVDGGNATMGDENHYLAYMKFKLNVPGRPISAVLRLYTGDDLSGDSGRICHVTAPWSEAKITYNTRPELGEELAKIGPVAEHQVVDLPLKIDLTGMDELSLAIDPTSCDGIGYISREGGKAPELIVEYER